MPVPGNTYIFAAEPACIDVQIFFSLYEMKGVRNIHLLCYAWYVDFRLQTFGTYTGPISVKCWQPLVRGKNKPSPHHSATKDMGYGTENGIRYRIHSYILHNSHV